MGGDRILGPYRNGPGWRYIAIGADGTRSHSRTFTSRATCEAKIIAARERLISSASRTFAEALEEYRVALAEKGNLPSSVDMTLGRLAVFFPGSDLVAGLTEKRAAALYERYRTTPTRRGQPPAADTHRNVLAEAKTFLRWCQGQRWIASDPFEAVEGVGRRSRRKGQPRIDEARRWVEVACQLAKTEPGAVAALMTITMGLRASEVVKRTVRDIDDAGRVMVIEEAKTAAGDRRVPIPEELQPMLAALARGKQRGDSLWPELARAGGQTPGRHWIRAWVQRICRRAGVPEVSAHGMRGFYSSWRTFTGGDLRQLATDMGHTSERVTMRSYIAPEALEGRASAETMRVLRGGKR